MMTQAKGIFLVVTSSLMFASYGVWSRLIGDGFGIFYQGWTRALIITLFLFPILFFTKQIVPLKREDWNWLMVFLIFTSLTQAPLFYAFTHMDIGSATLLFFVSFLLTTYVVGLLFLNDKFNTVKVISFLFALAGLYLTFSFSIVTFTVLAAVMAVLNGIASGGEVSFSKKLSGKYSALYLSWISWIAILITNAPISFLLGERQPLPSFDIIWLFQLGYVIASILGFWFVIEGFKYVEASSGGLLGLLEIVFSIAFGIFLFGEILSTQVIIGGCLILLAAVLPHLFSLMQRNRGMQEQVAS